MPNWDRFRGSCAWLMVLTLLSVSLPSCTLAGAGIGAGIDALIPGPYEERPPAALVRVERNERVIVVLRNGTSVTGRYLGTHGPTPADLERYVLVSTDNPSGVPKGPERLISVQLSELSAIAVEVTGKGWLYGGLIGLAADATLVLTTAYMLHNLKIQPFNDPSGCFC